jgi:hypothetical protein
MIAGTTPKSKKNGIIKVNIVSTGEPVEKYTTYIENIPKTSKNILKIPSILNAQIVKVMAKIINISNFAP